MRLETFIASRLLKNSRGFSNPVIRIAIVSVALGLGLMILSVCIVTGFQNQVRDKIVGFDAHIRLTSFENNISLEPLPIKTDRALNGKLKEIPGVNAVNLFACKAGIIKTDDQIEGVVFKGVDKDFNWSYFNKHLVEGKTVAFNDSAASSEVIVSKTTAQRLKLRLNDPLRMYFIIDGEPQPRGRKFTITGIYETGMKELDKLYVIGDLAQIQRLNGWNSQMAGGMEINIDDFKKLDTINELVYQVLPFNLNTRTIKEMYPQIFDWLALLDMNVIVILVLMIFVSSMAMVSTLLILILERTVMIGVLKSLGARRYVIREIFLIQASYILIRGIIIGNVLGLGVAVFQKATGLFKLPADEYFVNIIPISLKILPILWLNLGTMLVCVAIMLIPSMVISRISPVKSLRFS